MAPKMIQLNFMENANVGNFASMGQWKDPRDKSYTKDRGEYYVELAKLAEKGKITTIFFTDSYGNDDAYEKSPSAIFLGGGHVAHLEPMIFLGSMAMATKSVGLTVTCTTTYIPPYLVARSFSTLDHISRGRIGWNVVTSFSGSGGEAMGLDKMIPHDERYERADEFMDMLYELWEGSWEDGAQVFDKERDMAYDPKKVHKVQHEGKYYKMYAYNHAHPSPQRTPVLFQAGASPAGQKFAAKHAEAVFISGITIAKVKKQVQSIRDQADQCGRDGSKMKFYLPFMPTIGKTHEEAVAKYELAKSYAHTVGGMARFGGLTGFDLSVYPPDEPFDFKGDKSDVVIHSHVDTFEEAFADKSHEPWTPRMLGEMLVVGLPTISAVGSAAEVADVLENWMSEANIDGFNMMEYVTGESFKDVVEFLVPELQKRGVYPDDYPVPGGTLRENVFGIKGQNLVMDDHPAHKFAWNVRETNHKSVWDLRQNGLEMAAAEAAKAKETV